MELTPLPVIKTDVVSRTHRAAQQFETQFIAQMLAPMFAEVGNDPTFGGGAGEEAFHSMMVEQYATSITKAGGFGLSQQIANQLLQLQQEKTA